MVEVGKKYNYRNLYRMRKYYEIFSNEKLPTLSAKLSWSHYSEILWLEHNKFIFYARLIELDNLLVKQLRERIISREYKLDKNPFN